jgi:hypothetical protein
MRRLVRPHCVDPGSERCVELGHVAPARLRHVGPAAPSAACRSGSFLHDRSGIVSKLNKVAGDTRHEPQFVTGNRAQKDYSRAEPIADLIRQIPQAFGIGRLHRRCHHSYAPNHLAPRHN